MGKKIALSFLCFLIFVIGAIVVVALPDTPKKTRPGEKLAGLGNAHVLSLTEKHEPYNSVPPTSGPHIPRIAPWGVSEAQVPDELHVKNLEDGGVILSYDPIRVASSTIQDLKDITGKYPEFVLMNPYTKPALPSPIVLTAWTRLLKMEKFDEKGITEFIDAYKGIDHHKK